MASLKSPRGWRAVAVFATASLVMLPGCRSDVPAVELTGRISNDTISVDVPAVVLPAPNTAIGSPSAAGAGAAMSGGLPRSGVSTAAVLTQAGAFATIDSVEVSAGEHVEAGDVLVRLDSDALEAGVIAARASARVARARVGVLESLAEDLGDKKVTIADARAELVRMIAQLESTLADLKARRASAAAALAQVRRALAALPTMPPGGLPPGGIPTSTPPGGVVPTNTPPGSAPTGTPPGTVPGRPPGALPDLPDPEVIERGVAQLDAAIDRLESGLRRARSGLARLDDANAQVADGLATVEDAIELARIAADASGISTELARRQLESSVVRAPLAGVVTQIVSDGDVLAPGATAARIRPRGAAKVNGWIGFQQASRVSPGDRVLVSLDSRPGERYEAHLTRIGGEAVYPPTYVATREVHLGRAVLVEAQLEDAETTLPVGTPCDITIVGSSPARQ